MTLSDLRDREARLVELLARTRAEIAEAEAELDWEEVVVLPPLPWAEACCDVDENIV